MSKEFVLVRWVQDETVGVMPATAAGKGERLYPGLLTKMKWKGKKSYEVEILKISSKFYS